MNNDETERLLLRLAELEREAAVLELRVAELERDAAQAEVARLRALKFVYEVIHEAEAGIPPRKRRGKLPLGIARAELMLKAARWMLKQEGKPAELSALAIVGSAYCAGAARQAAVDAARTSKRTGIRKPNPRIENAIAAAAAESGKSAERLAQGLKDELNRAPLTLVRRIRAARKTLKSDRN